MTETQLKHQVAITRSNLRTKENLFGSLVHLELENPQLDYLWGKNMDTYVYYEADCTLNCLNPFVPLDSDNPTLAAFRQKPLKVSKITVSLFDVLTKSVSSCLQFSNELS